MTAFNPGITALRRAQHPPKRELDPQTGILIASGLRFNSGKGDPNGYDITAYPALTAKNKPLRDCFANAADNLHTNYLQSGPDLKHRPHLRDNARGLPYNQMLLLQILALNPGESIGPVIPTLGMLKELNKAWSEDLRIKLLGHHNKGMEVWSCTENPGGTISRIVVPTGVVTHCQPVDFRDVAAVIPVRITPHP